MTPETVSDLDKTLAFSRALHDFDEVEPLLKFLISRFILNLEAERGFLILFENDRHVYKFAQTLEGSTIDAPKDEISTSLVDEAIRRRRALLVCDALDDPHFADSQSIRRLELLSAVCAPLMTFRSGVLGVIYLDNRSEIGRFSQRDCDMLEVLALHAGAALESASQESPATSDVRQTEDISQALNQQFRRTLTSLTGQIQASHWLHVNGAANHFRELQNSLRRGLEISNAVEALNYSPQKEQLQLCELGHVVEAAIGHVNGLKDHPVKPDVRPVQVECGPLELQKAIEEVLRNAWEATQGKKDRRIQVAGGIAGSNAWVTVTDNGTGFTEESQSRADEPFFSTKRNAKGMGLTVAQAILKPLGGMLTWVSQAGLTEVRVELPNATQKPESSSGRPVQKARILLVDDSSASAGIMVQTLVRHGHEVTHINAPDEAESRLKENWDLLMVDGGFSLSQIQSLTELAKALPDAPAVILLTSWSEWSQAAELSQADMAVSKPIQLRYLPRVVNQALQAR
ncbi:MAG: GAF domain-containing protein [Planctomycetota bacterium]|jgi:signal transduction histidine kinase|nr:GAF domain-containing protein [Planctomycetota bacterium]